LHGLRFEILMINSVPGDRGFQIAVPPNDVARVLMLFNPIPLPFSFILNPFPSSVIDAVKELPCELIEI